MSGARAILSQFMVVSAGKVISLGALLACSIVVARFSGPAELGRFSAALTIVLLLDVALGSPLDYAAVRFSALHRAEPDRVARFHKSAFLIKLVLIALMLAAGFSGRALWTRLLFKSENGYFMILLCTGATAALLLLRSCMAWLQSAMQFRRYAALDILNGVFRVAALVGVGLLDMRSAETFLGVFAGAVAATYAGSLLFIPQRYLRAAPTDQSDFRAMLGYFGATAVIMILGSFTGRSDLVFVKSLHTSEDAGLYASAAQLASTLTMFASYACLVIQPRLLHAGASSVRRLGWFSIGAGLLAAAALLPACAIGGGWVLARIYGPSFPAAAPILMVLMIGACLDLVFMPVLMTYAMQTRALASMSGEVVVTLLYVAGIAAYADRGTLVIAWIATATRGFKLVLYTWLALTAQPPVAASIEGSSA